jgi:hypothetical protein
MVQVEPQDKMEVQEHQVPRRQHNHLQ